MYNRNKSKSLNKAKGDAGEKIAVEFLIKIGYKIIKTNFRSGHKEIDIIAESGNGVLNFIEVKSRFENRFGRPIEAVDNAKKDKIIKISQFFMNKFNISNKSVSYGLISIEFIERGGVILIYFENACD
ncbi:MAG: YraN family protein [Deltaproteobacteria bacterium]|nr:YraN family protein [Deltaproteobacteria bacterium]